MSWSGIGLKRAMVLAVLPSLFFVSCSRAPQGDNAVVARVGKNAITVGEFKDMMARRGALVSDAYRDPAAKETLLEEVIRLEVLAARAGKEGYFNDPEISIAIKRLVVKKLEEEAVGRSLEDIEVTDGEIAAYYRAHLDRFAVPERIQLALIQVAVPAKASPEKKAELAARAAQVREEALHLDAATRNFGYLAAQYSDDQVTRYKGGQTGWIATGGRGYRWPDEIVKQAVALAQPGEISPVIETEQGYFMVRLVERRAADAIPLEQVKLNIRQDVAQQKMNERLDRLYAESRAGLKIKIDHDLLNSIQPPAPTQAERPDAAPPAMPKG